MFHQKTLGIGIIFYFKGVKTEEISLGFEYGGVDIGDLGKGPFPLLTNSFISILLLNLSGHSVQ